jgi:hypothetical protein
MQIMLRSSSDATTNSASYARTRSRKRRAEGLRPSMPAGSRPLVTLERPKGEGLAIWWLGRCMIERLSGKSLRNHRAPVKTSFCSPGGSRPPGTPLDYWCVGAKVVRKIGMPALAVADNERLSRGGWRAMKRATSPILNLILTTLAVGGAIVAISLTLNDHLPFKAPQKLQTINVPPATVDIEGRLTAAIKADRFPTYAQGFPSPLTRPSDELAHAVASKMRNYPAEYNKPGTLLLGDSTPVQLVVKTNESQDTTPYFKDFAGEVTIATVMVASDVSAKLTGPPDMLQITLRGEDKRTILSPVPITWIWDVKPLKPGKANVTLEVTSYIKKGNDTEPVPFRVLQDTWVVEAHGIEWMKYQIEQIEPIRAFIVAMVAGVAAVLAWFGIKGWGKSKPDFES